jgi:hypothetical protein
VSERFVGEHSGRPLTVELKRGIVRDRLRLLVDGMPRDESTIFWSPVRLHAEGAKPATVEVELGWLGQVERCVLLEGDWEEALRPEGPAWAETHPRLYAWRHAGRGIAQSVILVVGISSLIVWHPFGFLFGWLPDISFWPSIDLNPDISWPTISLPGWVSAVTDQAAIWIPALAGLVATFLELRRRRRARRKAHDS